MGEKRAEKSVTLGTLVLVPSLFFAEPLGLVLSGGGAKGAYEVGVWKAMVETGVATNVRVISGTSVGALNAALFASVRDPVRIERLWTDRIGELLKPLVDDIGSTVQDGLDAVTDMVRLKRELVEANKRKSAAARGISVEDLLPDEIAQAERDASVRVVFELARRVDSGCTELRNQRKRHSAGFRNELRKTLPRRWPDEAPLVYATALSMRERKATPFRLNDTSAERRSAAITASCAIPKLFEPVTIDGVDYQDGGVGNGGDNTPIRPILQNHTEIRTIVVVYLDDEKRLSPRRIRPGDLQGRNIVEIIPSQDSGGVLGCVDASVETTRRLIRLGYRDARQAFADKTGKRIKRKE